MPIRIVCPSCSAALSVKDEFAGRAVLVHGRDPVPRMVPTIVFHGASDSTVAARLT